MPTLKINGQEITVDRGTTLIEAASQMGVEIPHFCYHPALSRPANCRMCLVEVEKAPKLMPACYTQAADDMVVHTQSDAVVRARKAVLEFILLNHPIDCPICDQAGECKLQDLYFQYSAQQSRLKTRKVHKVKVFPIGPEVVYDGERCILCTRCVRFCDEVTETHELTTVQRADMAEIRTFPGMELDNDYSLCTVDLCPVGALTSRDFRFKCRVWYLSTTSSVCTGCARGCNIHLEHFKDEIQRYRPRPNPEVNKWWMCDHGRKTYHDVHQDRLLAPRVKGQGNQPQNFGLAAAVDKLSDFLARRSAEALGMVLSPQMSCEGLYAAIEFAQAIGIQRFYLGGKPDSAFTLRNDPTRVSDDFLIEADKNPNRAGLLRLAESFGIDVQPADALANDLESGTIRGAFINEANLPLGADDKDRLWRLLEDAELVIYQGRRSTPFATLADICLPASSHAEENGTFINCDGIRQSFDKAFEPHGLSLPHWEWYLKLSKRLRTSRTYQNEESLAQATTSRLAAPAADAPTTGDEAPGGEAPPASA